MELNVNKLKAELKKTLPGISAQYEMAPVSRPKFDIENLPEDQYRPSAVMILFCKDEYDNLFIPLIERMAYNGTHSAQISFPGGKYEMADENLQNTAIRECYEEIGLRYEIEIIGKLTRLFIPVSSFLVEPYVGVCKIKNPLIVPHEREVKSVLKLSLSQLLDDTIIEEGVVQASEFKIKTPYFLVEGHKIWGATAMMLNELKAVLKAIS
ncbi:MAG: CoA pyrophosphatase [Bacteroidetes bacterium]|nr:CoA pyrophosphatase [Bacteroidota bacterium]